MEIDESLPISSIMMDGSHFEVSTTKEGLGMTTIGERM